MKMKVVVLKRYERNFRIPLYKCIKSHLKNENINLEIVYGEPSDKEKENIKDFINDNLIGTKINNKYLKIFNSFVCYQPYFFNLIKSDIIIVQQGNRELINFLLILRNVFFKKPILVFWGHGKNFQGNSNSFNEKFKKWYSNKVDYWFAYNKLTKSILIENGFKSSKIFTLNNTIDTKSEIDLLRQITNFDKQKLYEEYKITLQDKVGIFCGSIYKDKQIEFLLQSLKIVKNEIGNFKFFVIGSGECENLVKEFASKNSDWFYFLGNQYLENKIKYFSISDFQTLPGAVGLNIIDSFAFKCPLITTHNNNHGPEIDYLINNKNGVIVDYNIKLYSEAIIDLINNEDKLKDMKLECEKSSHEYSIENMAYNFISGLKYILKNEF